MRKKRIISGNDTVIHLATANSYAQPAPSCKKHGLNAFVEMKPCERFYTLLFFIVFHGFDFEIRMQVILTRQVTGTLKFILLTELSTGWSRQHPPGAKRTEHLTTFLQVIANKTPSCRANRFQRLFKRLQ